MPDMRLVLLGSPYPEPRYYGRIAWSADGRHVHILHQDGGKDSRHSDGATYITSTEEHRPLELRVPTSDVTHERINFLSLPSSSSEPPVLPSPIKGTDLVLHTSSVGTAPRLAVEIAANAELPTILSAWQGRSDVSSINTLVDKRLDQTLIVALAPPSTSSYT